MGSIKKKTFDASASSFREKYSSSTKYKETSFYFCGDAFLKACGIPGPAMGGINMFLGHSNTAKTNAMILAAADAQKKGHYPIFIITEKKFSFEHAVELGLQAEKNEDGEWVGDFIYNDSFNYIEQITDYINEILNEQEKGNIPYSLLFLWDSIGSVPCKMTYDGKGGRQHNASALAEKIGMNLYGRINSSKSEKFPYYNTLVIINQPWVDLPDNPFSQPEIKAKGGESVWLSSTLVFLFGNQKKSGINHIDATKSGRKVTFGIRTKISILKNHVNGLGYKDGRLIAVPQGFIEDTKESIEEYKKKYSEYWNNVLGGKGEYVLEDDLSDYEED